MSRNFIYYSNWIINECALKYDFIYDSDMRIAYRVWDKNATKNSHHWRANDSNELKWNVWCEHTIIYINDNESNTLKSFRNVLEFNTLKVYMKKFLIKESHNWV